MAQQGDINYLPNKNYPDEIYNKCDTLYYSYLHESNTN